MPFAEVFEVGSTAVPGLIGKGDLDVLVRCPAERFSELTAILDQVLSFNPEQLNDAQYRGYHWWLPDGSEGGAVQATVTGCPYDSFLEFREALLAEPRWIEAYNRLKREYDGHEMARYREAKAAFIERVLAGPEQPMLALPPG